MSVRSSVSWQRSELDDTDLARTPAGDNAVVLDRPFDDHDGIVQTALDLGDELLGPAPQHQGASLGFGTAFEEVEALAANLSLLEALAPAQMLRLDVGAGRLDAGAHGLNDPLQIVRSDPAGAEDVPIGEIPERVG